MKLLTNIEKKNTIFNVHIKNSSLNMERIKLFFALIIDIRNSPNSYFNELN